MPTSPGRSPCSRRSSLPISGTQSNLDALAQQLVPPGVSLISQGSQSDANPQIAGQQDAAQVIAAALVTKDGPGLDAASSRQILSGFAQHGFLGRQHPDSRACHACGRGDTGQPAGRR